MTTPALLSVLATVLLVGVAAFQLALAAGAPWGDHAWGGAHRGRLPVRLRAGSALSAAFLGFAALVLLARGGALAWSPLPGSLLGPATWALAALFGLNTLGNLAARTNVERFVFGGATAALAAACVLLALRGPGPT